MGISNDGKAAGAVFVLVASLCQLMYLRPYQSQIHTVVAITVLSATTSILFAGTLREYKLRRFGIIVGLLVSILAIVIGNVLDIWIITREEEKIEEEEVYGAGSAFFIVDDAAAPGGGAAAEDQIFVGRQARSYTLDDINVVEVEMDALDDPNSIESPTTAQAPVLVSSTGSGGMFGSTSNFGSVNNFDSGVNNFGSVNNFDSGVNNFGSVNGVGYNNYPAGPPPPGAGVHNFGSGVNNFGSGNGVGYNNYPAGPPPPSAPVNSDPFSSVSNMQAYNTSIMASGSVAGSGGMFVENGIAMSSSSSSSSSSS